MLVAMAMVVMVVLVKVAARMMSDRGNGDVGEVGGGRGSESQPG